jgi:conjugative relaxase-like TrwC/TraI family protein
VPVDVFPVRSGRHRYYLDTVAAGWEDHRAPGLEPDGTWEGSGTGSLGLDAAVGQRELAAVMSGADPATGEALRSGSTRVRLEGYDVTFSAPKAVSLLFALGDGAVATEVLSGHSAAVSAVVAYAEGSVVRARRGSGEARRQVPVEGIVAAGFVHRTSRAADPHLHTHVLVANLARGADGRWSALDARGLFGEAPVMSALYFAHLRQELVKRLGLVWRRGADGRMEVDGIGPEVRWAFSRRRQQVESWLEERGLRGARSARTAALSTRARKDPLTSFDALRPWWAARARAVGLGVEELAAVVGRGPRRLEPPSPITVMARQVLDDGFSHGAPRLSRPEVVRAWSDAIGTGAPVRTVEALTDAALSSRLVDEVAAKRGLAREASGRHDEGGADSVFIEAAVDASGRRSGPPLRAPEKPGSLARSASELRDLWAERDDLAEQLSATIPPDPGMELRELSAARAEALRSHRPRALASLEPRFHELERQVESRTAWTAAHEAELSRLSALRRGARGLEVDSVHERRIDREVDTRSLG